MKDKTGKPKYILTGREYGSVEKNSIDDEPVSGATGNPISSDWAYNFKKEIDEQNALEALMAEYNAIMDNERYSSHRMGYEQR